LVNWQITQLIYRSIELPCILYLVFSIGKLVNWVIGQLIYFFKK